MQVAKDTPLQVLVLDDDPAFRRIVVKTFERIEGVAVVGSFATAEEIKRRLRAGTVDLISLDVVLAEGSGLDLLSWLTENHPQILTVLLTSGQERRASQKVDATLLGASSLVLKPSGPDAQRLLTQSLSQIVSSARAKFVGPLPTKSHLAPAFAGPRELIAVGSSTGGPAVLLQFLKDLPQISQVPLVVTQHLASDHVDALVTMLNYPGGRKVTIASHGDMVSPNQVYVAGNDRHLQVTRQAGRLFIHLSDTPAENFCRPAVDPMFRSVASTCLAKAIGVVMTGMGSDGAKGAQALRANGAPVVVQDQASSIVWGMPGATVALGAANEIVAGSQLGRCIAGLITNIPSAQHREAPRGPAL